MCDNDDNDYFQEFERINSFYDLVYNEENNNSIMNLYEDDNNDRENPFQFRDNSNKNKDYSKNPTITNNKEELNEDSSHVNKSTKPMDTNFEVVKPENIKIKFFNVAKKSKEKNILKRKRNRNNNNGEKKHTKYDFDNIARKIKSNLFKGILIILNNSLEDKDSTREVKFYTTNSCGEIHSFIRDKGFLKISQEYISGANVQANLDLLELPLRKLFSQDCSKKYKNYISNNKNLLQEISDNKIYNKTNRILDMTVRDCLEHFRGTKKFDVLNGLEKEYQNLIDKFKKNHEEKAYIEAFQNYLIDFEIEFQNKKPKKCGIVSF